MPNLVLFTRDLRVHDHPALFAASSTGEAVVPLFVLDPRLLTASANRTRFLLESLADVDRSLRELGGGLVIRRGDPVEQAVATAMSTGCETIFLSADASSYARERGRRLAEATREAGIGTRVFEGHAIVEPGVIGPSGRDAYRVFTPYYRAWSDVVRRDVLPPPSSVTLPAGIDMGPRPDPSSVVPDSAELAPGGETEGRARTEIFLTTGVRRYGASRNDPAHDGTSRLSAYLRFGCISANELERRASAIEGAAEYVRQLAWRDFYFQLLAAEPTLAWKNLKPGPPPPEEVLDGPAVDAWRAGRTGIPLVDAGMRQLMREGWMHNRVRMVVANFLTRRMGVPWQVGAEHFSALLVDGDPANNSGGWQWTAGTGTDPRPSRTFNPVLQAERHDPDGIYIKRFVEELSDVAVPQLYAPWTNPDLLRSTGYPEPLIELRAPRGAGSSTDSTTPAASTTSSPR